MAIVVKTTNETEGYRWLTYEGVVNTFEGHTYVDGVC